MEQVGIAITFRVDDEIVRDIEAVDPRIRVLDYPQIALAPGMELSPEQRTQALGAIAQETERSVAQLMGGQNSDLWQAYQRTGSQWIRGLSDSDFVVQSDLQSPPAIVAPAPVPRLFPFIPQQPPLPPQQ